MALLLGFAAAWQSAHAERQSLAAISLQAESFLSGYDWPSPYPPEIKVHSLDARLNLAVCAHSLDIAFANPQKTTGNTTLTVKCPAPVSWRIHLPVRIDLYDDVLVTRAPILRGQPLQTDQVKRRKTNTSLLQQGYFKDPAELQNMQAKQSLKTGTVLTTANLAARKLVTSGQRITMILDIQGLQVKTTGVALQSAALGELIKVRNPQSNRVVEGVVSGAGQVKVSL